MIFVRKHKLLTLIILVLAFVIAFLTLYLEHSYKNCHAQLSKNFMKNVTSFSCYDLKKVTETKSEANILPGYSNVYEIKREKIGGSNGLACSEIAFVADDLPKYAKDYVAFHEYIHTQGKDSETLTNITAGLKKPIGFVQTIPYSLQRAFTKNGFNNCSLAGVWKIFKVYFLNDSFEDLIKF